MFNKHCFSWVRVSGSSIDHMSSPNLGADLDLATRAKGPAGRVLRRGSSKAMNLGREPPHTWLVDTNP